MSKGKTDKEANESKDPHSAERFFLWRDGTVYQHFGSFPDLAQVSSHAIVFSVVTKRGKRRGLDVFLTLAGSTPTEDGGLNQAFETVQTSSGALVVTSKPRQQSVVTYAPGSWFELEASLPEWTPENP